MIWAAQPSPLGNGHSDKSKELGAAETLLTENILERRACSNFERANVIAGKGEEVEECQAMGDNMYAASFSGAARSE